MRKFVRFLQLCALVIGVQAVLVSDLLAASAKVQLSPTAITDIKTVAGKWEGIMIRTPRSRNDDWVNVSIQDSGDYEFASYREIGVFSGKGTLTLKDGKAVSQGEKGSVTVQLFTDKAKGQSMLKAEGKGKDGVSYRAELKKAGEVSGKKK
jgi:hypothetical protein